MRAVLRRSLLLSSVLASPLAAQRTGRPNLVLIISDDHGWTDYGFMGHRHIRTPNIDRLAREGLTFERGYVPTSLCRPSLATLMTGLYPHQHKIVGNDPAGDAKSPQERGAMVEQFRKSKILTELLAGAGYVSHQSGKWWEGECTCFTESMTHGDVARGGRHGDEGLKVGRETMQPVFDFIDRATGQKKPFFIWYAPMMPHTPHNPPQRFLTRYQALGVPLPQARYFAMVEWFDETVGQLMTHLEKRGTLKDTVIA